MVGSTKRIMTVAPINPPPMATAIGPQNVLGISGSMPSTQRQRSAYGTEPQDGRVNDGIPLALTGGNMLLNLINQNDRIADNHTA